MRTQTSLQLTLAMFLLAITANAQSRDAKTPFPNMAPVDQYMMERTPEIALARTAAPDSISKDAEVLVLGRHAYETAVKGTNGFVCIVQRSWTSGIDDPDFWNPKLRAPICYNAAAARTVVPLVFRKTKSVLAGRSKAQMFEDLKTGFDKKELPALESGAMCYMLSKQGYLNSRVGHWHPHLMFFAPLTDAAAWGANQPGSPLIGDKVVEDRSTVFMVPVAKWSDGTSDGMEKH